MAKPSKIQQDRRAVVEQMRKDQKRAESKRTVAIVAVCVVVALVIVVLGALPLINQWRAGNGALATLGTAARSAGCQPITTKKADGNQVHRPGSSLGPGNRIANSTRSSAPSRTATLRAY